jgi:pectate lyase
MQRRCSLAAALALTAVCMTEAAARDAAAFIAAAERAAAEAAAPPVCPEARVDAGGRVQAHPVVDGIPGTAAGTTGGLGRRLLLVTDPEDVPGAARRAGTLRWAVDTARREGGAWIAFSPALRTAEIRLSAGLRIPSDTTLDGGCGTTLRAPAAVNAVVVSDASNVIVTGLRFVKDPYSEPEDRIGDAVGLAGAFDRVAVLHNHFSRCGDGCVDVVRREALPIPGRVTVAFNRFETHNKVMLVGALVCTAARQAAGCDQPLEDLAGAFRPSIRVTVMGNVFLRTSQRHPKAVATAFVHSVNNLFVLAPTTYSNGRMSAVYGGSAASGGLIASEGDIFVNLDARPRIGVGPVSAQRESEGGEADGAVAVRGAATVGPVRVLEHMPLLAWQELSAQPAPVARDALGDPTALAACLLRHAGPAGSGLPWSRACDATQNGVQRAHRSGITRNQDQSPRAEAGSRP